MQLNDKIMFNPAGVSLYLKRILVSRTKIGPIKHAFFTRSFQNVDHISFKVADFDLNELKFEFFSLYQLFISNKSHFEKNIEIAFLLHFLCDLMLFHYQSNENSPELKKLKKQKEVITEFIKQQGQRLPNELHLLLLKTHEIPSEEHPLFFKGISKLSQYAGNINSNRSKFGYSRNLAANILMLVEKSSFFYFIQRLQQVIGHQFTFAEGINFLNKSREPSAILGIILSFLRFLLNLIMLMKKTLEAAINSVFSVAKVLKQELQERGFIMANDFVWGTVTLLTTYNNLFHISSLAVPPITLIFLVFDFLLLSGQWLYQGLEYNRRKHELATEKKQANAVEQSIIQRQLDILEDEWKASVHYYAINILAATILACGYALTLLCSGPVVLLGIALVSMLGNALYNTANDYKKYQQTRIALHREQLNGALLEDEQHHLLLQLLNKECDQSQSDFWKTLAYNVGGIAFIISATIISWPVAVCLTVAYLAYQLKNTYQNHSHHTETPSHDIYRLIQPKPAADGASGELVLAHNFN